ncbi:hypothetical protein QFW82_23535 [Streptomyces malaysiensis subsp. malaysiensis]|uniref:hypothetical protein n=1 Tax=Streptomyces malaysiensis TaxID=92644 RepID=UPI0024C0D2A7|nr:hypothetical protein [Streptomyces sp. NA07423]WHX19804.1 hypothetical protein QFW82_23535 [Streptomyces sp. NA07423]
MGVRLFVEVLDYAPSSLTHREKLVLAVLAEDAPDETRITWSSVEAPRVLRRGKVSRPQMYEVLKALTAKGVLERVSAGQKNATAKYRIRPLTPSQGLEFPDTDPISQRPDSADTDQSQHLGIADTETPAQHPVIPDADESQCQEIPDVSVREPRTPTPQPQRVTNNTPAPDAAFDAFWQAYPRKIAKGAARRAWSAALKRGADPTAITAAAARHADHWRRLGTNPQYIPYPATWLNGERYDDALETPPAHTQAPIPGTTRYTDPSERGIF